MDIVFSFVGFYIVLRLADRSLSARGYRGPKSDHFNGKIFLNYIDKTVVKTKIPRSGGISLWKWLLTRPKNDWVKKENTETSALRERVEKEELVVTFINHTTVLIQTEGLNILTDPIWSRRASPFSFFGPKRFREPGVLLPDLPPIDAVLISHNHYDHMDIATLRAIVAKWNPKIYVGLGNEAYLKKKDFAHAKDMDWWDREALSSQVSVVAAPAQHFSSRAISDRNKTLWCGYVLETPHGNIYFAGDTGYGPFVQKIKECYTEFRLALIPIGAYKPRAFMHTVHISPDEAFHIHKELNVHTSIGIHFGTFRLADDRQEEPRMRILELSEEYPLRQGEFMTLANGESMRVP